MGEWEVIDTHLLQIQGLAIVEQMICVASIFEQEQRAESTLCIIYYYLDSYVLYMRYVHCIFHDHHGHHFLRRILHGNLRNLPNNLGKFGVPRPVTGSQSFADSKPGVPQPWLPPSVISFQSLGY